MKYLLMFFMTALVTVEAANASVYETSLFTGTLAFFLLMLIVIIVQFRRGSKEREQLEEKEKKITWLRQLHAEKEQAHLETVKELEKENLRLSHKIEELERKLQEGTKNQVVHKIEALQKKRHRAAKQFASEA